MSLCPDLLQVKQDKPKVVSQMGAVENLQGFEEFPSRVSLYEMIFRPTGSDTPSVSWREVYEVAERHKKSSSNRQPR